MKRLALMAMVIRLCLVPLGAQVADRRLEKAVERIEKNDADGLRRLLAQDPSLVRRTAAGVLPHWRWTLLHVATTGKAPLGVVRVLVDAGSDVNAQDNEGNTPLHFSVKRINRQNFPKQDYDGIIRLLLDKKGDVHMVNLGGMSPLHTAVAFKADPSAVEILIQAGADVITVLLKHGADPAATDGKGMTALQVAERGGFADAAKVLRAAARVPAANTGAASAAGGTVFNANAERAVAPHREERRHQARNARECPPAATDQGVVATRLSNL